MLLLDWVQTKMIREGVDYAGAIRDLIGQLEQAGLRSRDGNQAVNEAERQEWLRWLVEDSLVLSSEEKIALLGKLDQLSGSNQGQLLEILLDERRLLDRMRRRAFECEETR